MLKGIIFDLDGVLVDTEGFHLRAWDGAFKGHGVEVSKKEYIREWAGHTGTYIATELIRRHGLDIQTNDILEPKEELMLRFIKTEPLNLMFYAHETVDHFYNKGFPLGIVSGGPRPEVDIKLKRTVLIGRFKITVSQSEVQNGKPHPDIYQPGVERLGLKPEECITFEDTSAGVRSAKAAGVRCYAVPNEYTLCQDFSMADQVFENLKEAVEQLSRQTSALMAEGNGAIV